MIHSCLDEIGVTYVYRILCAALCGAAVAFLHSHHGAAHEIVGNRFFPATLAIDDPGVNDELALPTVSIFKTGDDPSVKQLDISAEFSKRITEDFAVSFAPTWTHIYAPGGPNMTGASGFQNMETTFKYRVFKNAEHEFVMSVGLNIEWGGSGAQDVGAERFTIYTPTLYFGKGFGDLPIEHGLGSTFRRHRPVRLRHTWHQLYRQHRSRHRRLRHRVQSAGVGLGRLAAIQLALSEIRCGRSRPAEFLQSPDPDRRSVAADAGANTFAVPAR